MNTQRKSVSRRRQGRGSVLVIAALLISSGVLRLATGVDIAAAKVTKAMDDSLKENAVAEQSEEASHNAAPKIGKLLTALQEREALVKTQETAMAKRQKALEVAGEEIERRLVALKDAEEKLRATLSLADGASENDLTQLTEVYEQMKPKVAAALFEQMEPTFAAGFLGRMNPAAAAAIMAGLSPEVAYSISVIFAGRNASVPKG